MNSEDAAEFCSRWLPAWTGNEPRRLAAFYTEDAYYSDPAVPDGLRGREALTRYFEKLLAGYPDWVWRHQRSLPVPDGFLNYWSVTVPRAPEPLVLKGVCVVQLREGCIYRNEVYFDSGPLRALRRAG